MIFMIITTVRHHEFIIIAGTTGLNNGRWECSGHSPSVVCAEVRGNTWIYVYCIQNLLKSQTLNDAVKEGAAHELNLIRTQWAWHRNP